MSNESWLYDNTDTRLYQTSAFTGSDATVEATEVYTSSFDLTKRTVATIDLNISPVSGNSVDDFSLSFYRRRSDSLTIYDAAISTVTIANAGASVRYSTVLDKTDGPGWYRLGMKSAGSTTEFDVDIQMRTARLTSNIETP